MSKAKRHNARIEKLWTKFAEVKRESEARDYANLKVALLDLGKATYETLRGELIARLGYDGFRDLQNKVFREIGTIQHEQSERRTFYFCTGVQLATLSNPPYKLGEHETLSPNGVLLIKFECDGVPPGASFAFACSNPSLYPGAYIVRPILSGGLLSEYAYFTKPTNTKGTTT